MHELLTVPEVAKQLRVDVTTVRRWIKEGFLKAVTLPHRGQRKVHRIEHRVLEAMISSSKL